MKTLIAFLLLCIPASAQDLYADSQPDRAALLQQVTELETLAEQLRSELQTALDDLRTPPPTDAASGDPAASVSKPTVVLYTDPPNCIPCRLLEASIRQYGENNLPFEIVRRPPAGHAIPRLEWGKWYHSGYEPIADFIRRWEHANSLDAGAAPSPQSAVTRGLDLLNLQSDDVLLDPGCGDGRVLAAAADRGIEAWGIEIDAQRAQAARESGVSVITGDATEVDWGNATVGYVYLYPDTLEALKPKLTQLDRFVSLHHPVPGLRMRRDGDFYVWEKTKPVVQSRPYAVYGGQVYYGRVCSNPRCAMCAAIQRQLGR